MGYLNVSSFSASRLHLVIWNRVKRDHHFPAMDAFLKIMTSVYSDQLLALIRPVGRSLENYRQYQTEAAFKSVDLSQLTTTQLLDNGRTAHCEVWFQVSNAADQMLKDDLATEFAGISSVCHFWDHRNPVWAPFGEDLYSCQYASSRSGCQDKLICSLCDSRVALLMKMIWHSASREIVDMLKGTGFVATDPQKDIHKIRDLMSCIIADIDLTQAGIQTTSNMIDPTDFAASHMAAFAVNSVTEVRKANNHYIYQLEQYYHNRWATHPNVYPTRTAFLSKFTIPS